MLSFIFLVIGVLAQQTFTEEPEAIVGGQHTIPGEFPYLVSVKEKGIHVCGGSIIDPTKILTAAHCVYGTAYTSLRVTTGTININGGQFHEVKSIRIHPGYSHKPLEVDLDNDVAVITLSEPIQYNKYQKPIALTETKPVDGQQCTLAGWGKMGENGRFSRTIRKMNQLVMSLEKCQKRYSDKPLTETYICAFNRYGIGFCEGDSGGPLVSNGVQIGIASWSEGCGEGLPDIYTNVYHHLNFIKEA